MSKPLIPVEQQQVDRVIAGITKATESGHQRMRILQEIAQRHHKLNIAGESGSFIQRCTNLFMAVTIGYEVQTREEVSETFVALAQLVSPANTQGSDQTITLALKSLDDFEKFITRPPVEEESHTGYSEAEEALSLEYIQGLRNDIKAIRRHAVEAGKILSKLGIEIGAP